MNKRAVGVIVRDDRILLMKRIKNGRSYLTFPGGSVEEGETEAEATVREMKEELSIDVTLGPLLFTLLVKERMHYYYLVKDFTGDVVLGSADELSNLDKNNQYIPLWLRLDTFRRARDLFPREAHRKVMEHLFHDNRQVA